MATVTERVPLFLADLEAEVAATRRMLRAFPAGKAGWRPHEKSRTAGALATHVATLPKQGVRVLAQDGYDVTGGKPGNALETAEGLLAEFDVNIAAFKEALAGVDEASLGETWSLRQGAQVLAAAPRAAMLRLVFLSHLVHHRAQLGVYYRLLGVPVPGMYGPTADERPGA